MAEVTFTPEQARHIGSSFKLVLDRHADVFDPQIEANIFKCIACKASLGCTAQIPIAALIAAGVITVAPTAAVVELIVAALGGIGIDATVDAVAAALSTALGTAAEGGAAVVVEELCKSFGACS